MKNALSPQKSPGYTLVAECLYRNDASGIYYALIKRGGKQIRRSLKTSDRKLAERRLVEFREKVGGLDATHGKVKLSFSEVAGQWISSWKTHLKPSSARRREGAIAQLAQSLGQVPVRSITRAQCEAWAERRSPDVAAATFNLERDTLQMILDYAKREGLILDNPAEVVQRRRQPKQTVAIPSRDQFVKMLSTLRAISTRCHPAADLMELLAYSGMRKGEANAFRLADVDFDRNTFNVTGGEVGTKNHEARVVPLFPMFREFLERLQKEQHPAKDDPLVPIVDAKKAMHTACKLNGYTHFSHHCLRHFFVSNAIEKGVDFKTIAAWIGHKDGGLLVAKTYGHLRDTHSTEMAKRMTL
jgi:integrase